MYYHRDRVLRAKLTKCTAIEICPGVQLCLASFAYGKQTGKMARIRPISMAVHFGTTTAAEASETAAGVLP